MKIVKIILSIMLISYLCIPFKSSNEVEANSEVYLPILQEVLQQYGYLNESSDGYANGVVYAKLADFDSDGTEELYFIVLEDSVYKESLYKGSKLVYSNELAGPGAGLTSDNSLSIAEAGNGIYLRYVSEYSHGPLYTESAQYSSTAFYIMQSGEMAQAHTYQNNSYSYHLDELQRGVGEPGFSEELQEVLDNWDYSKEYMEVKEYIVLDTKVSEEEYFETYNIYDALQWENIIYGGAGSNSIEVDSNASIEQVLNELYSQSVPTTLGEDIKGNLDGELLQSMMQWLSYSEYFKEQYRIDEVLQQEEILSYVHLFTGARKALNYESISDSTAKDFPKNTFERVDALSLDNFIANYLGQELPVEDFESGSEDFPYVKKDGYYYLPDLGMGWNSSIEPYIESVFELAQDIYYVKFTEYEVMDYLWSEVDAGGDFETALNEVMANPELMKTMPVSSRGYAVMKKSVVNGQYVWTLVEKNTVGKVFDESIIENFKKFGLQPAQIKFDIKKVEKISSIDEVGKMLDGLIADKTLNEYDLQVLSNYISVSLQKVNQQAANAKSNKVNVQLESFDLDTISKNEDYMQQYLEKNKISLHKGIQNVYRLNINQLNLSKPIEITFNRTLLELLNENNSQFIYISLDGSQSGMLVSIKNLQEILKENKEIVATLSFNKNGVEVAFKLDGKESVSIPATIQLLAPAEDVYSVVKRNKSIIGGQFNDSNKSIVFETKSAGSFKIEKNKLKISDIDKLSDEAKKSIEFVTTRGLLQVTDNKFNPDNTITRNEFAQSIVSLFFVLEENLETSFTDVNKKDPYYDFIASGEKNKIIEGYLDQTFRGELQISRSHMLSFVGRTLIMKKGYQYPENVDEYLNFVDKEKIYDDNKDEIALTVREGIIDQGGLLEPQSKITKQEAAQILNTLYDLLYEEPIYLLNVEVEESKAKSHTGIIVGIGIGVALLGGLGVFLYRKRKMKAK